MTTHDPSTAALVIFDDGRANLGPLDDLRPAFALRSGAMTNQQRIEAVLQRHAEALFVPDALAALAKQDHPNAAINQSPETTNVLAINGRWFADDKAAIATIKHLAHGQTFVNQAGDVIAACTTADAWSNAWPANLTPAALGNATLTRHADLLARPWHLLENLDDRITGDLAAMSLPRLDTLPHGVTRVGEHPISAHPDAALMPHVHLDTTLGPIAFDAACAVHPFTVIEGPCYIGRESVIAPHTSLRAGCVIGRGGKIGGEVKASIVDDFTNKAHDGYLGNAIVGRWCNLGAGTTASNLKNTWGDVRVQLDANTPAQPTGRTFQGPILGDFVRTAIGTTLPTGAVVGTAACLVASGFPPKHVPALTFLTDAGPQPTDLAALMRTLERMMQRRQQTPSAALAQRLAQLQHDTEAHGL